MKDATKEAITQDGWLKSGDLGYLDDEGFLFIKDRSERLIGVIDISWERFVFSSKRLSFFFVGS